MRTLDVVVIGGGIAGMSAAAALAGEHRVLLCELETSSDRHSTGRSAAAFIASYGNTTVRSLNAASRGWFDSHGDGWSEQPLLHRRPALWIGGESAASARHTLAADVASDGAALESLTPDQTAELCPVIVDSWRGQSLLDPDACDIDVAATMVALRRQFLAQGGELSYRSAALALTRSSTGWTVSMPDGDVSCATVVNAAGAWADDIARLAGMRPVRPAAATTRRLRPAPSIVAVRPTVWETWPLVLDLGNRFYFKARARPVAHFTRRRISFAGLRCETGSTGRRPCNRARQRRHHACPAFGADHLGGAAYLRPGSHACRRA